MFQVPFPPNNSFVGRRDILAELEAVVHKNRKADGCIPTFLKGLGGMGKSQLMLKYCYAHRKEYKYVFWLNAEESVVALEEFQNLAEKLGMKVNNDEALAEHIRTWFQSRDERWLLMLDNVDAFEDVYEFIPYFGGDVIITTRNHVNNTSGSVIHVNKMVKEDALLLLLGQETYQTPPANAVKIVEELDCMPLAVDVVRAYINRTGTSLKAYLEIYSKKRAFLFRNEQDMNRNQYAYNVATVWNLSFEKLRERSKLAGLIIGACAFLHPDAIPVSLFERQSKVLHLDANVNAIREAIGILVQFSFVRRTTTYDVDVGDDDDYAPSKDLVAIHRLVQEVIRESNIMKDVGQKAWGELLVAAISNEVTSSNYHDPHVRKINDVYIPHIRNVIAQVDWRLMDSETQTLFNHLLHTAIWYLHNGGAFQSGVEFSLVSVSISEAIGAVNHPDLAMSYSHLAVLYTCQGKYDKAEPLYQQALAIREKALGPSHPDTAKSLGNLAAHYNSQAKYDEAELLYVRALESNEKVLGQDHPDTATSLNGLAELYKNCAKYDKAEPLYQRALAIREKVLGPYHPDTAISLGNLAMHYNNQAKYDEAEPLYRRALMITEKGLGPDHPDTATALNGLAEHYKNHAKYDKAEPLYQRALEIREKALGPDHPDTATSLGNLAKHYSSLAKYDEAELLYQRALVINEKGLGPDHPETAASLNGLALLYLDQGKYKEAEPLQQRALAINEKVLGPDHRDTATSLNDLALLYESYAKYDKAELLYQRALTIREKVLGPEHPDTATSLNNLANIYKDQGKHDEAKPLYQRALRINEKVLGPDHPDTAACLNNLALLYLEQGKYDEAELLHQRELAISEKVFGPDHPETATSLSNLAMLYENQGKYDEAEPLRQRALVIIEKVLGPDHPNSATFLDNLAGLYNSQGKYDEVELLYQRALVIREKVLGPDHPNTATSLENLALLYESQGKYNEAVSLQQRALVINEKILGQDHPNTATSLNNLALLYVDQDKYDEAELLYKRALVVREKVLGPDHPDTATSLNDLAMLYEIQGKYGEAEPLQQRALVINEKALAPDHLDTVTSLNNLALLYLDQGKYDEAEPLYQRALVIREKVLGPDHPHTLVSLDNLATLYNNQGKSDKAKQLNQRVLATKEKVVVGSPSHLSRSLSAPDIQVDVEHTDGTMTQTGAPAQEYEQCDFCVANGVTCTRSDPDGTCDGCRNEIQNFDCAVSETRRLGFSCAPCRIDRRCKCRGASTPCECCKIRNTTDRCKRSSHGLRSHRRFQHRSLKRRRGSKDSGEVDHDPKRILGDNKRTGKTKVCNRHNYLKVRVSHPSLVLITYMFISANSGGQPSSASIIDAHESMLHDDFETIADHLDVPLTIAQLAIAVELTACFLDNYRANS